MTKSNKITKKQSLAGRKRFDGKDEKLVLSKLRGAWDIGAIDEEACSFANISVSSLQRFLDKNPQFRQERDLRKQKPILKARQTVFKNLDNVKTAKWYLERQRKTEFSTLRKELIGEDEDHPFRGLAELMKAQNK